MAWKRPDRQGHDLDVDTVASAVRPGGRQSKARGLFDAGARIAQQGGRPG
ncbi:MULTISPECIES: hypothetical protein [Microbacterium]|nr:MULTISPECIES: hypothetical protein [Microbacterium]MDQ1082468.1 hypothetical protein [Microbacterium sp. SORGH_AS_0344]